MEFTLSGGQEAGETRSARDISNPGSEAIRKDYKQVKLASDTLNFQSHGTASLQVSGTIYFAGTIPRTNSL